jgi:ubiquinone/menaquinone biosynthesis C-methylase UbiE
MQKSAVDFFNARKRFSDRVESYSKYRPGYPTEIISFLKKQIGFSKNEIVADIGAGTGIFAELLLKNGKRVFCVEPNDEMRAAAEKRLSGGPNFKSVNGAAEQTNLANASVDLITVAQAFHWFDPVNTRKEFQRILKANGYVVLIWNDRDTQSTPFLRAYEKLIREFCPDYSRIKHKQLSHEMFAGFWKKHDYHLKMFANRQVLDFRGLKGRSLSTSYIPNAGHSDYEKFFATLKELFERHQKNSKIEILYTTKLFYGRLE